MSRARGYIGDAAKGGLTEVALLVGVFAFEPNDAPTQFFGGCDARRLSIAVVLGMGHYIFFVSGYIDKEMTHDLSVENLLV